MPLRKHRDCADKREWFPSGAFPARARKARWRTPDRTGPDLCFSDSFQQSRRTEPCHLAGIFRNIETYHDVTLSAEIVNFVRLYVSKDFVQRAAVIEITVDQPQARIGIMRILIDVIDTAGIERARSAHQPID